MFRKWNSALVLQNASGRQKKGVTARATAVIFLLCKAGNSHTRKELSNLDEHIIFILLRRRNTSYQAQQDEAAINMKWELKFRRLQGEMHTVQDENQRLK